MQAKNTQKAGFSKTAIGRRKSRGAVRTHIVLLTLAIAHMNVQFVNFGFTASDYVITSTEMRLE